MGRSIVSSCARCEHFNEAESVCTWTFWDVREPSHVGVSVTYDREVIEKPKDVNFCDYFTLADREERRISDGKLKRALKERYGSDWKTYWTKLQEQQ